MVKIQSKLDQLQVGLDSNRAEVGNLLRQIDDLQEARNEFINGEKEVEAQERDVFDEPQNVFDEAQCTFRTDAVPRADIQVSGRCGSSLITKL